MTNYLNTWLLKKPIKFAALSFCLIFSITLIYSFIAGIFHTNVAWPLHILLIISIIGISYKTISSISTLPIHTRGFIAIINGNTIITFLIALLTTLLIGHDISLLKLMLLQILYSNSIIFWTLALIITFIALYLLGLFIVTLYAKYKQITLLKISKWKIICSLPFTFFMLWIPAYTTVEKKHINDVEINSKWYKNTIDFISKNQKNAFLSLILITIISNVFAGLSLLLTSLGMILLYWLWALKFKKDLKNNLPKNYATMVITINLVIWLSILITAIFI